MSVWAFLACRTSLPLADLVGAGASLAAWGG